MWCCGGMSYCVNGTPLRVRLAREEQCSSLKMILGSKHVGAILNVLI